MKENELAQVFVAKYGTVRSTILLEAIRAYFKHK